MTEAFYPPHAWGVPRREAQVLNALLRANNTASKEWLHEQLYADEASGGPDLKIIDVFVCKLRPRLERALGVGAIETVWGRGYRIDDEVKALIRSHNAPPAHVEQAA